MLDCMKDLGQIKDQEQRVEKDLKSEFWFGRQHLPEYRLEL